eukprot:TRINITY_DN16334_c0_g1_i13.p1 TRINITY_DN16334_c0_g1~~TRINITY_DN16334_c0_g1_i13.p1  ORF type:complete len:859 (+),score=191.91 TRINITY_DN16334_c0_g1_i13:48-2624(+)
MRMLTSIGALLLAASSASANTGCSEVDLGVKASTKIFVCSDSIVRVAHTPQGGAPKGESLVVKDTWSPANYKVSNGTDSLTITTEKLEVVYFYGSDTVGFRDAEGNLIVEESQHTISPSTIENLYSVSQTWKTEATEGIYGGGQYQDGFINWAGSPLSMVQYNTQAVVPFFMSTKGYGILWDSYSWTHLNDGTEVPLKKVGGSLSVAGPMKLNAGAHNFQVRLCRPWGCGGNHLRVNLTDTHTGKVFTGQSWEGLANIPDAITARFNLPDGEYNITVEYDGNHNETLYHNSESASQSLQLRSEATEAVDYYFMWGGSMDGAVAGYRNASGASYLYGKYAYGFWQCKNRYHNQSELTNAAIEFRKRQIPVDNIVQDWMYWGSLGWGPHWDPTTYPQPAELVKTLNENNFHFMVSVWAKFARKTTFYKEMNESGYMLNESTKDPYGTNYYDPFNPAARSLYYNFSNENHFKIGVDALWLDATEPESLSNYDHQVYLGSGTQYLNPFSLMTTKAIADGLRKDYPTTTGARVFSLTRSSFAGQQRTGAALWSGDITSTWDTLRRQIAASINYQMSGIPYWSEDIGGFFRPSDMYTSMDYWCMLTRWFQFGVFTPIFRVHGTANTELWNYGPYVQRWVVDSAINLRYRLLPYIYTGFRRVEQEGYTMQRGMPFDFPNDVEARNLADQFMFGESLLIAPIFSPNNTNSDLASRSLYLPVGGWWDFNSGATKAPGHQSYSANILQTPIFVRDGTILVMGPKIQHTGEDSDPLEIRIYGNDATFTLYEDDGKSPSMNADHQFSEITFTYKSGTLTVSDRKGSFPGMLNKRTLNLVKVAQGHGVGVDSTPNPDKTVTYSGTAISVEV